jgi:hypothetical protein
LEGVSIHADAYSFITTNLDVSTGAKAMKPEAWYRMRTDIEDRIRMPNMVPRYGTCPRATAPSTRNATAGRAVSPVRCR